MTERWQEDLRNELAHLAIKVEDLFTKEAKPIVSIVVRCAGLPDKDADVVVSGERDIHMLLATIQRRIDATVGGDIPG